MVEGAGRPMVTRVGTRRADIHIPPVESGNALTPREFLDLLDA